MPIAALRSLFLPGIIRIFERALNKAACCTYGPELADDYWHFNNSMLERQAGYLFGGDYAERIIGKY